MATALDRDLSHPGQPVQGDHDAHHEDLGMARQGQVRVNLDAPRSVQTGAGLFRELAAHTLHTDSIR